MSLNDPQDQGGSQGDQPQQPTVQQIPEAPQQPEASPAGTDQPNWVAPDYGISWATKSAPPKPGEEKRG